MKAMVLKLIESQMDGAIDNQYRISRQFRQMNEDQLDREYGESGRTCRQFVVGANRRVDDLKKCKSWVEAQRGK